MEGEIRGLGLPSKHILYLNSSHFDIIIDIPHGNQISIIILIVGPSFVESERMIHDSEIHQQSNRLVGRTYLVTGSTDGIGLHTGTLIVRHGGNLIVHGRNPEKIAKALNSLRLIRSDVTIASYCYDLSTIQETKRFARQLLDDFKSIDGIVSNAGIYTTEYHVTSDGLESTFAVNVAAPYILSILLLPLLKNGNQPRLLDVSSTSQEEGDPHIILSNLQFQNGDFEAHAAYSLSKLCFAAISHELALRVNAHDVLVICCDPSDVDTQMLRAGWAGYQGMNIEDANDEFKLITANFDASVHGKYFVGCRETRCNKEVYDDSLRLSLWEHLEQITGVRL